MWWRQCEEAHESSFLFFRPDEFDIIAVGVVEDGDEVSASEIGGSFSEKLHLCCFKLLDGFVHVSDEESEVGNTCLLYTSPSLRDRTRSRMPSSA